MARAPRLRWPRWPVAYAWHAPRRRAQWSFAQFIVSRSSRLKQGLDINFKTVVPPDYAYSRLNRLRYVHRALLGRKRFGPT